MAMEARIPQPDFDFEHLTQRPDWPVAKSEPVAFFGCQIFGPASIGRRKAPEARPSRRFGFRDTKQVHVVIRTTLQFIHRRGELNGVGWHRQTSRPGTARR